MAPRLRASNSEQWMPASPNWAMSWATPTPPWFMANMIMSQNVPPGTPELYLTQALVCRASTSVGLSSSRSFSSRRTKG